MNSESVIAHILETKSIITYLEQKGINPVKRQPGRILYCCPFPDHKEKEPSFTVYTNGAFENFYCFGCKANYHIIHLVAKLEGISFRKAVEKLADGAEITEIDETQFLLDKKWQQLFVHPLDAMGVSSSLLITSSFCRLYEDGVNHDPSEVERIDKFWSCVDECLLESDFNTLLDDIPPDKLRQWLKYQRDKYESDKQAKTMERLADGRK